jgi:hypothetical protein
MPPAPLKRSIVVGDSLPSVFERESARSEKTSLSAELDLLTACLTASDWKAATHNST